MGVKLTIHCVTSGRPTLEATLASIRTQIDIAQDEVLLVCDSPSDELVILLWRAAALPGRLLFLPNGPHGDWGHTPRNETLCLAKGDYIVAIDDDDVIAPHALYAIRKEVEKQREIAFFLFRMVYASGKTLWRRRTITFGNVGTPMFVHPTGIQLATYTSEYGGDLKFIRGTIELNTGLPIVWSSHVITLVQPHDLDGLICEPDNVSQGALEDNVTDCILCYLSLTPSKTSIASVGCGELAVTITAGSREWNVEIEDPQHNPVDVLTIQSAELVGRHIGSVIADGLKFTRIGIIVFASNAWSDSPTNWAITPPQLDYYCKVKGIGTKIPERRYFSGNADIINEKDRGDFLVCTDSVLGIFYPQTASF